MDLKLFIILLYTIILVYFNVVFLSNMRNYNLFLSVIISVLSAFFLQNATSQRPQFPIKLRNETNLSGSAEWQSGNGAKCYDRQLSTFINTALSYYSHNMGAFSKYILNQIVKARYAGNWLVHAEMISNQRQGFEWQSATNGDLFAPHGRPVKYGLVCQNQNLSNYITIAVGVYQYVMSSQDTFWIRLHAKYYGETGWCMHK